MLVAAGFIVGGGCTPGERGEHSELTAHSSLQSPSDGHDHPMVSTELVDTPHPPEPTQQPTLPPPPELLDRALEYRSVRDDATAAEDFLALVANYPNVPEARRARYYLAEGYAIREHWTSAVAAFRAFVDEPVQDDLTPPALFWIARGHEEAGNGMGAIEAYAQYRQFHTVLEPYAAIRQAAQQQALGLLIEAAHNYEHGAASAIDRGQRIASYERAIALYRDLGDHQKVMQLYRALLDLVETPSDRARILAEAAQHAEIVGQPEQARAWMREIIATAPTSPQAITVLDRLIQEHDPNLSPAEVARVLVAAERYDAALPVFDQAIGQAPPGEARWELQRLRAIALRSLGLFPQALESLAAIGNASPDSEVGRQARLDWVQTLGQSGQTEAAARAYEQYAATYPDDPRAPVALDRAAQLWARLGNTNEMVRIWLELEQRYPIPSNETSAAGLHGQAMKLFLNHRPDIAQEYWERIAQGRRGTWRALGAYWAGRAALSRNQPDHARKLFEMAYAAAPDSYYGARAAEQLSLPASPKATLDSPISASEWRELEQWIAAWSGEVLSSATEQGYSPEVLATGYVQRAIALNQVGLHREAMAEWNDARMYWKDAPIQLMVIARMAHEYKVPYIALLTAKQILALASPDAPPPPTALRRVLYPTPYPDLVAEQSRTFGIDPRLLYALMRQESLFNPLATSWVGARGLGQVMPATGQGIAAQLGVSDFHIDDLYRPHVSIRFSAYYIAQQIAMMQGSIHAGLSAYNGGPGNAQRWAGGRTFVEDVDLFTEGIDYSETRNYVKLVYGYYRAYQELYSWP